MAWIQIAITADKRHTDTVEACLLAEGAMTVTLSDAADQPILEPEPGAMPLWEQAVITGLFPERQDPAATETRIRQTLGDIVRHLGHEILEDRNWTRAWMEHYRPMQFGERFWVCPWHLDPPDPQAINLRLDPGLAFGTGTHPTTALCLRWLATALPTRPASQWLLDFGCGSGILAIAARLLGVARVDGIDIDPQALQASRDNAQANRVETGMQVYLPEEYARQVGHRQYDIVMANVLSGPLLERVEQLAGHCKPGGHIVLSGILQEQADGVSHTYRRHFDMQAAVIEGDWAMLHGIKRRD